MEYRISPDAYFRKIVKLYQNARLPKFQKIGGDTETISRGRSSSISSSLEDLTALFIAKNNPNFCRYFIDQPIKFPGDKHPKYPDIVIQNIGSQIDGEIKHVIDVKTDMGWNRKGLIDFCKKWEEFLNNALKQDGRKCEFKTGAKKIQKSGYFAKNMKYHVIIISKENSGTKSDIDRTLKYVNSQLRHVYLYFLSEGIHPNDYAINTSQDIKKISINYGEFDRLFSHLRSEN
ncbi:hypothetical protein [uncultured Sneathiella sp.]|jgi:hypothetical protein|uniref:hypothetical protein n=1 Tax=uncultured Sneathiella sp. TaxID=879315 RepID=UPI0030DAA11B